MIHQKLILIKNRNEVRRVFLTEFDAKKQRELDRRDAREEGREEGRQEGRQESQIVLLIKKIKKGQNLEQIADALETSPEELKEMYEAVIAAAPEYDVKKIYQSGKTKKSVKSYECLLFHEVSGNMENNILVRK